MTTKTKARKRLHVDEESRALMANPAFRQAIEEAKRTAPDQLLTLEELDAKLQISEDEKAAAEKWLDNLDAEEETDAARRER